MQITPANLINAISADSENTAFPAINMLLPHAKETWATASGVYSSTVHLSSIGAAANGLILWNMLGSQAIITVYAQENLAGAIVSGPTTVALLVSDSYYTGEVQIPGYWLGYTSPAAAHSIKIEISRSGAEPEIGIAWAGKRWEISSDPSYAVGRGFTDHSIVADLGNGFEYLYDRNTQRRWPLSLELRGNPPTEFFTFLEMLERIGPNPVPVLIADNGSPQYRYLIYARFVDVSPSQAKYNKSTIGFTLKEYL